MNKQSNVIFKLLQNRVINEVRSLKCSSRNLNILHYVIRIIKFNKKIKYNLKSGCEVKK